VEEPLAGIDVEALYKRYGPMVIRRCQYLLDDDALALDASQEVFVKLWQNKDRLTGESCSGLLLTIATRTCLKMIRSRNRHREDMDDEMVDGIASDERIEDAVLARLKLDHIFCRERPSTRLIAVLHYVDGLTYEQVAKEVGMSVSGVRKRLRTLRERSRALEGICGRD
jgi:RNA polymerase sigma-70 factor (ECF subfamily)